MKEPESVAEVGSQASAENLEIDLIERQILRKCDFHVLPMLFVFYMLSYLDRINIGNARIEGLERDLKMTGNDYNIALQVFFVPYILLEVPSNILLKRLAPSTWLSFLIFMWGIITMCQGLVTSLGGLVACRFFLGCFEAGLAPGCAYIIGMYYKRYEMQKRYTIYNTAGIVAGAFGGFLAYALVKMDGLGGYAGWRWIFIIEGLLTTLVALASKFLLVDWPEHARFLKPYEKVILLQKLSKAEGIAKMNRLDKQAIRRVMSDGKIWTGGVMFFGTCVSTYSLSYYLPTVLSELGYSSSDAQVQTIPIYAAAFVVAIATAWTSDRLQHRFTFVIVGAFINVIGYVILLAQATVSIKVRYMALYFVMCGLWISSPVEIVWLSNNIGGHYKRAIGTAIQISMGNLSGFISSNTFITQQAPTYPAGYSVALAATVLAGFAATLLYLRMKIENKRRDSGGRDDRLRMSKEDLDNLGDDHPDFRFAL